MKKLVLLFIAMSMLFVACPSSPSISNVAPSWAQGTYQYGEDSAGDRIVLVIHDSKAVLTLGAEGDPDTENTTHEFGKEINEEAEGTDPARKIKTTVVTNSNSVFEFHVTETETEVGQDPTTTTAKFKITTDDRCVMTVDGAEESNVLTKKNS